MNDFKSSREERRAQRRAYMHERWMNRQPDSPHSHIWTGLFLLVIGGLALAKSFGVPMPVWLFTWQMLLIGIGLVIGLKKGFRTGGWFVPILIGAAFLINDFVLMGDLRKHIWPLILIVIGAAFILRPRGKRFGAGFEKKNAFPGVQGEDTEPKPITPLTETYGLEDDVIDSTCIFSGSKKVILSKRFKGGDLTNIFGGAEIDLSQADMEEPAVIDVTAICGGAKLVVPANWAIQSKAVTIFGGITDKRKFSNTQPAANKTLILDGTIIFGGIEIASY